jgi:hypothetical protein
LPDGVAQRRVIVDDMAVLGVTGDLSPHILSVVDTENRYEYFALISSAVDRAFYGNDFCKKVETGVLDSEDSRSFIAPVDMRPETQKLIARFAGDLRKVSDKVVAFLRMSSDVHSQIAQVLVTSKANLLREHVGRLLERSKTILSQESSEVSAVDLNFLRLVSNNRFLLDLISFTDLLLTPDSKDEFLTDFPSLYAEHGGAAYYGFDLEVIESLPEDYVVALLRYVHATPYTEIVEPLLSSYLHFDHRKYADSYRFSRMSEDEQLEALSQVVATRDLGGYVERPQDTRELNCQKKSPEAGAGRRNKNRRKFT